MINLTIPLYPYIPSGNVFPWDSPYHTEDIATYERNAARLFYISLGSDTGTRLMAPSLVEAGGLNVCDLPLSSLLNREAIVLRIPKSAGECIDVQDLEKAIRKAPQIRQNDAIVVVTNWGDSQRWKTIGVDYVLQTPHFSPEGGAYLKEFMADHNVDLLLTDCAMLDGIMQMASHEQWLNQPEWIRLPYPSENAKAYLRKYESAKSMIDFSATRSLLTESWIIAGLANAGQLTTDRVILNCLPMFIQNAGETPCTVVGEFVGI